MSVSVPVPVPVPLPTLLPIAVPQPHPTEEARLAVEQIVLPKGQPVELLPRSPKVRKMQHELVEHYRLVI